MDNFIDGLFAFDIVINFRSCYIDPKTDNMVEDPNKITQNYMQGRFWIDLCASIPFEIFQIFFQEGSEQLKFFGMLKLIRLMRLGRMVSFLKANKSFKLGIILVQLLFILILVIHWIACMWYLTIGLEDSWLPPKDADWDKTIIYEASTVQKYIIFFYYSVLTLVTNELMPTTGLEVIMASFILLSGSLIIGVLIGEFSSIMNDMGEKARKSNEEFDNLSSVMVSLKLPEEI